MKTQISKLINGSERVMRDLRNEKYENADKNIYGNYVGSKKEEREEVANQVFVENSEIMQVEVKGVRLSLRKSTSLSGKTIWYSSELTDSEYKAILGHGFPSETSQWSSSITINQDMTVCVNLSKRKNERCQWKHSYMQWIGEEFVTIL